MEGRNRLPKRPPENPNLGFVILVELVSLETPFQIRLSTLSKIIIKLEKSPNRWYGSEMTTCWGVVENETPQRSVPRLSPPYGEIIFMHQLGDLTSFVRGGGVVSALWATSPGALTTPPLNAQNITPGTLWDIVFSQNAFIKCVLKDKIKN